MGVVYGTSLEERAVVNVALCAWSGSVLYLGAGAFPDVFKGVHVRFPNIITEQKLIFHVSDNYFLSKL